MSSARRRDRRPRSAGHDRRETPVAATDSSEARDDERREAPPSTAEQHGAEMKVSDELERWLGGKGAKTLDSLIELFGEKSFAILFVLLLGVPALPLPTGGATHVFEVIAVLLAAQLVVGRRDIWLPQRWSRIELAGPRQQRFIAGLMRLIRRLERISRPRLRFLFGHRLSNVAFGLLVIAGSAAAFVAPPFSGLDTLPALGVVLLSLGVLLEDFLVVAAGIACGVAGGTLEAVLGRAAISGIEQLL